ncbi:hypothetical protein BDN70DRAFT_894227 [Pholiota conissans]|uniref:Uncharacterized protein n=1 Tax=Pholiota conissans TaxID=109636 RepID=A0A9P5Z2Q9_9AGAR|nr:hypothetical protein BDN70DRAFT_894227 [Pholiota conissans]
MGLFAVQTKSESESNTDLSGVVTIEYDAVDDCHYYVDASDGLKWSAAGPAADSELVILKEANFKESLHKERNIWRLLQRPAKADATVTQTNMTVAEDIRTKKEARASINIQDSLSSLKIPELDLGRPFAVGLPIGSAVALSQSPTYVSANRVEAQTRKRPHQTGTVECILYEMTEVEKYRAMPLLPILTK